MAERDATVPTYKCHNLYKASVLSYAGFELAKVVSDANGRGTWTFLDPEGDAAQILSEFTDGTLSISSPLTLLRCHDGIRISLHKHRREKENYGIPNRN